MFVDRFKLVRQRVHARDGKTKIGIELVRNAERIGLQGDPQEPPVAIVGERRVCDRQVGDVIRGERDPAEPLRTPADESQDPDAKPIRANRLYLHRLTEQRPGQDLPFANVYFSTQPAGSRFLFILILASLLCRSPDGLGSDSSPPGLDPLVHFREPES